MAIVKNKIQILNRETVNALPSGAVRFDKIYELINLSGTAFTVDLSTLDFTNAQKGGVFMVDKHNSATNPLASIPAINVFQQLGTYQVNQDNFIQFIYLGLDGANHKVLTIVNNTYDYITQILSKEPIVAYNEDRKGSAVGSYYEFISQSRQQITTQAVTSFTTMRAFVFALTEDFTFDEIKVECSTGLANALFRYGLYECEANFYPTNLIPNTDFQFNFATAGVKTQAVSPTIALVRNKLYAIAIQGGVANHSYRALAQQCTSRFLGLNPAMGASAQLYTGWQKTSQPYGASPSVFPTGATKSDTLAPYILHRKA